MDFVLIIAGLVLLVLGGEWLLQGAVSTSLRLHIPKSVIGMTVVSFATSSPELIVSIQSALTGHGDIALGNVLGSNVANLGFVLAITAMITPLYIGKTFARIDWPVLILVSSVFFGMIYWDESLDRYEGVFMVALLILYLFFYLEYYKKSKWFKEDHANAQDEGQDEIEDKPKSVLMTWVFLIAGGLALYFGSELLIEGSVNVASSFGVSERVIGITIVSIGTSLPELVASVVAALRKEKAISLGNLVGSNIFNILAVLGITSIISPIRVSDSALVQEDLWWLMFFAAIILPLIYVPNKRVLGRKEGFILFALYITFIYYTLI